jgi:hypothetical protein
MASRFSGKLKTGAAYHRQKKPKLFLQQKEINGGFRSRR